MGYELGMPDRYTGKPWKPAWDKDFRAGFAAAARAKKYQSPRVAFNRSGRQKYGSTWIDGYGAYIDLSRGAYATTEARYAKKLGLSHGKVKEVKHTITGLNKKMATLRKSKKAHRGDGKLTKPALKSMRRLAGQKGALRAKRSK